jgi:hypothetical protein
LVKFFAIDMIVWYRCGIVYLRRRYRHVYLFILYIYMYMINCKTVVCWIFLSLWYSIFRAIYVLKTNWKSHAYFWIHKNVQESYFKCNFLLLRCININNSIVHLFLFSIQLCIPCTCIWLIAKPWYVGSWHIIRPKKQIRSEFF